MFCVYVLENPAGKLYVGQTENLAERLKDHNRTDCFDGHFTRRRSFHAKKRALETRLAGRPRFSRFRQGKKRDMVEGNDPPIVRAALVKQK